MTSRKKTKTPKPRSGVAVAMFRRFGSTTTVMKDRRAPRAGARNEQADLLEEYLEDGEAQDADEDQVQLSGSRD